MTLMKLTSFYSLLQQQFRQTPSRVALEFLGDRPPLTYSDLEQLVERFASLFARIGLKKGDRVASQTEKSPEALALYLACLRSGMVYLPMNTAYQEDETDFIIGNAEPALFVTAPALEARNREIAKKHAIRHLLTLDTNASGTLMDQANAATGPAPSVDVSESDLACIVYTSGTTGRPKGAMLSHGNLASNARALVELWGFADQDILIHALPIFHVHGLFVACHCALLSGARMIWLSKFDDGAIIKNLPRATVLMGVPTFYTRLLANKGFTRELCANMRLFVSGSAPLLEETFRAFEARTGHSILERYGMSETGMNTSNPLRGERRPGTVGFPLPGTEVRITSEDGGAMPRGETGMIEVRGPNVFSGYWRKERSSDDFTADGFFRTGDLGLIDPDGYVHIVGRAKDLIITGGYNVYPKELESLIDQMPGVLESAVIGLPDPDFGESVTAVIKAKPDAMELTEASVIASLKAKIANYKVPKRVFFVEELPRNTMGKVQKKVLRERFGNSKG